LNHEICTGDSGWGERGRGGVGGRGLKGNFRMFSGYPFASEYTKQLSNNPRNILTAFKLSTLSV